VGVQAIWTPLLRFDAAFPSYQGQFLKSLCSLFWAMIYGSHFRFCNIFFINYSGTLVSGSFSFLTIHGFSSCFNCSGRPFSLLLMSSHLIYSFKHVDSCSMEDINNWCDVIFNFYTMAVDQNVSRRTQDKVDLCSCCHMFSSAISNYYLCGWILVWMVACFF